MLQRSVINLFKSTAVGLNSQFLRNSQSSRIVQAQAFGAVRHASSLLKALKSELKQVEEPDEAINFKEILGDSPFELLKENKDGEIVLKNGNVEVSFDPLDFEDDGVEATVPMTIIVKHEPIKKQLTITGTARAVEESGESEVEIEEISVESISAKDDEYGYTPKIGELDEELKNSFFEYLRERGVDDVFANSVVEIAGVKEELRYIQWLKDLKSFVEKEDA